MMAFVMTLGFDLINYPCLINYSFSKLHTTLAISIANHSVFILNVFKWWLVGEERLMDGQKNVYMAVHCQSVLHHLIVSSAIDVW